MGLSSDSPEFYKIIVKKKKTFEAYSSSKKKKKDFLCFRIKNTNNMHVHPVYSPGTLNCEITCLCKFEKEPYLHRLEIWPGR